MVASSDLGQPYHPRPKRWAWAIERIGFLATTFMLKINSINCDNASKSFAIEIAMFV